MREQRKVGLVPEDVTAHRLLIVAHLDVQMGGHVHQVPRTGSVSTTDDFGRTPIKGAHLQSAGGSVSGVSPCGNQSHSKALTCNQQGVSRGQSTGAVHVAVNVPFKGAHRPHLVQMDLEVAEPDVLETCAKAAVDGVLRAQSNRLELLVRRVPSGQVHREVIRGHQGSSGVIRGHQRSSEVI